jgi:hypothetical protein
VCIRCPGRPFEVPARARPVWRASCRERRFEDRTMKPLILITALAALIGPAFAAKKPKPPKPPSQEPIVKECITVFDIRSHSLSILSGIGAPEPGIEAKIKNDCQVTAWVFLHIGYFDRRGGQFASGIAHVTVGADVTYNLYHPAEVFGLDRGALKLARILKVDASPAP